MLLPVAWASVTEASAHPLPASRLVRGEDLQGLLVRGFGRKPAFLSLLLWGLQLEEAGARRLQDSCAEC